MKNRKLFRSIAVILLVCILGCTFAACSGPLKGTYTNKDGLIQQSFVFRDDNKVTVSAFGLGVEGEYEIADGKITITYRLGEEGILGNFTYDLVKSFERKGDSIFIDGVEFVKES